MPRTLTDPNYDDTLEWQERVTDVDGNSLSISVTIDRTDISNVAWANYTTTTNTINGSETEVLVDFTADASSLTAGATYQFEVTADDGFAKVTRKFTLSVNDIVGAKKVIYGGNSDLELKSLEFTSSTVLVSGTSESSDILFAGSVPESHIYYTDSSQSFARIDTDGTNQESLFGTSWSGPGRSLHYVTNQNWLLAVRSTDAYKYDVPGGNETRILNASVALTSSAVDYKQEYFWVLGNGGEVYVIDPSDGSLVKSHTDSTISYNGGLEVDHRNNEFFVTNDSSGNVIQVHDMDTFDKKRDIDMSGSISGTIKSIVLDMKAEKLYVSVYNTGIKRFDKDGTSFESLASNRFDQLSLLATRDTP